MTKRFEYFDDDEESSGEVTVACVYKGETAKAWWINAGAGPDVAIPKSQSTMTLGQRGQASEIRLPEWLAKAKGLI